MVCLAAQVEAEDLVWLSMSSQNGCRANVVVDSGSVCENLDLLRSFTSAFDHVVLVFIHGDLSEGRPFQRVSDCLDFLSCLGVDGEESSEVVKRGSVTFAEAGSLLNLLVYGIGRGEGGHSHEGAEGDALEEEREGCDVGMGDCDFRGCR